MHYSRLQEYCPAVRSLTSVTFFMFLFMQFALPTVITSYPFHSHYHLFHSHYHPFHSHLSSLLSSISLSFPSISTSSLNENHFSRLNFDRQLSFFLLTPNQLKSLSFTCWGFYHVNHIYLQRSIHTLLKQLQLFWGQNTSQNRQEEIIY